MYCKMDGESNGILTNPQLKRGSVIIINDFHHKDLSFKVVTIKGEYLRSTAFGTAGSGLT